MPLSVSRPEIDPCRDHSKMADVEPAVSVEDKGAFNPVNLEVVNLKKEFVKNHKTALHAVISCITGMNHQGPLTPWSQTTIILTIAQMLYPQQIVRLGDHGSP